MDLSWQTIASIIAGLLGLVNLIGVIRGWFPKNQKQAIALLQWEATNRDNRIKKIEEIIEKIDKNADENYKSLDGKITELYKFIIEKLTNRKN
jgi:flagellin-specific chaperone FliS